MPMRAYRLYKNWLGSAVKNPIRFVEALIPDEQAEIEAALRRHGR